MPELYVVELCIATYINRGIVEVLRRASRISNPVIDSPIILLRHNLLSLGRYITMLTKFNK